MGIPIFSSCLGRVSLRTGSIIAGAAAILLSIVFIILMYVLRFTPKTILFDDVLPTYIVKIVIAFNMCMTILISAIMIVGAHKRNHYLMLPWVVLGCILVIGFFFSVLWNTGKNIIAGLYIHSLVMLIVGLILVLIYAYMWCVVYSHFTVLREESKRGKYNRQPYRR